MGDNYSGIVDKIRARFVHLTPQQRIAAAFVLRRPEDVATVSMRTLASHAGVQPVTFVRLARTLGYESWESFRRPFVERMGKAPALYSDRAAKLAGHAAGTQLVEDVHRGHLATLETTRGLNEASDFLAAAEIFESAANVFVAGFRACFGPAHAFAYVYRLLRPDVMLLTGMGGGLEGELRAVGEGDAVCIMGFQPYSRESVIVAEHAARRGARLVAISDSPLAPFAREAAVTLTFSTEGTSFFPSQISAFAITEQLLDVIVARGGDAVIQRLKSSEAQLQALGVFVPATSPADA